jgi:biotin synthase-related radical SAM superfamily protein
MKYQRGYLDNPTLLKIELMLNGIRMSKKLRDKVMMEVAGMDEVVGGIDIMLPHKTKVNVPYKEEFTRKSPYSLESRRDCFFITDGEGEVKVEIPSIPNFYRKKTTTGIPFPSIGDMHSGYVVITPSKRCDFFSSDIECRYCTGNFDSNGGIETTYSVEEVLETVEVAYRDGKAEIIYLSIGFGKEEDGGIIFLKPYIEAIKKHFNTLIAVEALPPIDNRWVDETYAIGADSVIYNLEIFDKELFELICPGRAKLIGRERYIDALRYAATVFPSGTVASHLIVGLEPPGSTIMGIDYLTDIGVIPILPIYRPSPGRTLRIEPLTTEVIAPVYAHLYKTVKKKGINMHWVRDISIVTTPIEGRFLIDGGMGFRSIIKDFYNTKVGLKTALGLATLRRKLRVKESDESSGSSSF